MGRKKKKDIVEDGDESSEKKPALGSDAKRGIAAVFLFALAILFLLAFIGQAGSFGGKVDEALGLAVGWSRWLLIGLLPFVGVMLFRKRETTLSDKIKYAGLALAFISFLGLSHLFLGESSRELKSIAAEGAGGGYLGYLLSSFLNDGMGKVAAFVVLFAVFVTGVIAAFNLSLLSWVEALKARFMKPREAEQPLAESGELSLEQSLAPDTDEQIDQAEGVLEPEVSAEPAPDGNIQNIRFALDEKENTEENETDDSKEDESSDEAVSAAPVQRRPRRRMKWDFPPLELLASSDSRGGGGDIEQNKETIVRTLEHFGITVEAGEAFVGPTVTQYTFRPGMGVKLSRITTLTNNLALALGGQQIRIEAPIPGKALIGIEVPNKAKVNVRLRNFLQTRDYRDRESNLTLVLGEDIAGKMIYADLDKMPHVLIAGTTRSGKSVCVNTMLISMLYQNSPEDLQLILVDPKRVELSLYKGIPHLKTDVIVDNHKAVNALKWAVSEMERRYKVLEQVGSRDLRSYNLKRRNGERHRFVDPETNDVREEELQPLPQIVVVIDEMADLMSAHGKEVETPIIRLAQKARAVGLHLILATQRPEVNVITGLIKANMPARISFKLKSQVDSRTILDTGGAEKLLGNGDMLYSSAEASTLQRIQGVFVSEDEVKRVVSFLVKQKEEKGYDSIGEDFGGSEGENPLDLDAPADEGEDNDPIYRAAKKLVVETQRASTTYLQTFLKIGYPKAARVVQLLEKNGVIGPEVNKKREVLMKELETDEKKYGDDPLADQAARDKWQM